MTHPELTLWRSKADGSSRTQMTYAPMQVHMPRWSPDGSQIAFMASHPGKPWKIFVMPAAGGSPREVTAGDHNQGDPTWMPMASPSCSRECHGWNSGRNRPEHPHRRFEDFEDLRCSGL